MSAKAIVEWAKGRVAYASSVGSRLLMIVLPSAVEDDLFRAAMKENIPDEDYDLVQNPADPEGGLVTMLAGVKCQFSSRLPEGTAWFMFQGGKT